MYCLRSLGRWDRGFESHSGNGCLVCVCVALCLGSGLVTRWPLVQGVLPSIKMVMKLKEEAVEPVKKNKIWKFIFMINERWSVKLAARSKAWTVFARWDRGFEYHSSMDICVHLFCVCVALCLRRGLATGWSRVQGILPTVYRIKKVKKRQRSYKGLLSHRYTYIDQLNGSMECLTPRINVYVRIKLVHCTNRGTSGLV
jgi:hypothetical protein